MNPIIELFLHGLVCFISTFGFAVFMHTPKKQILYSSLTGSLGWIMYTVISNSGFDNVMSSFFAACIVGTSSEILARLVKAPSIIFIIPGIVPLVPGRGLYYTMEHLISKDYMSAISVGTNTLLIAGSISLGIIIVTSFSRAVSIKSSKRKIASFK